MNKARLSSELKQIRVFNQLVLDRLMHFKANRRLPKCPMIHPQHYISQCETPCHREGTCADTNLSE